MISELAQKLRKAAVVAAAAREAMRVEALLSPYFLFATSSALASYM